MLTYKLKNGIDGKPNSVVCSNGWTIPFVDGNTDYEEYKLWLEAGNTPEPADEVTQ
jgi:hypothetical protein